MLKPVYRLLIICFMSILQICTANSIVDSSKANGNWSDTATWKNGRVPHDSDYVVINNYVVLDVNVTLSFPGGGAVYISPKGNLCGPHTINCELLNYGALGAGSLTWQGNSYNYATITLVDFGQSGTNPNNFTNVPPNGNMCVGCPISCSPLTSPVAKFSSFTSICVNNTVTFTDESTGLPTSWSWLFPGGIPSTSSLQNPTVVYAVPGTYTVTLIASNAAGSDTAYEIIHVNPSPSVCCDTTIAFGQSAQLNASGGVTYIWSPSTGLSCVTCPNPIATPLATTTYSVTMVSDSGCKAVIPITVEVSCGTVFIPKAFSPNDDGQNDYLFVRGDCIKTLDFIIFDRWGNKVFETADQNIPWDGSYKGEAVNTGTYVYYLTATMYDGTTVQKKGNVTLVR